MGLYHDYPQLPRKRNDYTKEEIEKKYSTLELSRLILYNNIHNYSPRMYFPEKLCTACGKNKVPEKYQLSEVPECEECYIIERKRNFDYMLRIFKEENLNFEGDCIIENKLYLGNIRSSYLKEDLKKIGITHILMVGYYLTPIYPEEFIYENIEVDDNQHENILQYLIKGIKFIEDSKICFSHCQMGKSRSAAFVMAYVMYKYKIHFSKAFNFVRNKRRVAFPNEGFQCQLEDFDIIMSNFDYDLDKCEEFIKNYFEKRESLKKSEKDYLDKRFIEKKKENSYYSDSDDNEEDEDKDEKNDNNELNNEDKTKEEKRIDLEKDDKKEENNEDINIINEDKTIKDNNNQKDNDKDNNKEIEDKNEKKEQEEEQNKINEKKNENEQNKDEIMKEEKNDEIIK